MSARAIARKLVGRLPTKAAIVNLAVELLKYVDDSKVNMVQQAYRGLLSSEQEIADRVAGRCLKASRLKDSVENFLEDMEKYDDYGGSDTEPREFFHELMEVALTGKSFPSFRPEAWQLFDKPGWKRIADRLTKKAKKIYEQLQNAPYKEVQEAAKHYRWS